MEEETGVGQGLVWAMGHSAILFVAVFGRTGSFKARLRRIACKPVSSAREELDEKLQQPQMNASKSKLPWNEV